MKELKSDADVLKDGRKKTLKDSEELQVVVPLRDQIVKKLIKKLEDMGEGRNTEHIWIQGNADRNEWLEKQQNLLQQYDEFIDPIYDATSDWSSTLHLPTILTVGKTYHARMFAALIAIDPPFTIKARQSSNVERAFLIQSLMGYTLKDWINKYQGIEGVVDTWLWTWIMAGRGVLKNRWERSFSRYVDVVPDDTKTGTIMKRDEQGNLVELPLLEQGEKEQEVVIKTFDGPMTEFVPNEDILIIGGSDDPQEADHVLHSSYMTASQLWMLVDQKVFEQDAVEKVIAHGEDRLLGDMTSAIKEQQRTSSGYSQLDVEHDEKRYQIIERHSRIVVDDSGIASEIIMWVHPGTGSILRATYLYRVSRTGLRPFFAIDFHKRANGMPAGLPELLYSLSKEIDAMHNMKVDFGIISSIPFGFYRATSSLETERMPLEPGVLIPLDNPQTDVFFPNLGNRSGFTAQEEAMLMNQIERLTSISDISLGIVGGQGAARTATGARALLGESNANLDIFLRRMNRGWKRMLTHLFHMIQDRIEPGFQFRVLGDDGSTYWETVRSRQELAGMYDFELEGNSANSNKQIQIEQANSILSTIANPFFIQIGIVGPNNIFNAIRNKFQVEGVKDWTKFITKPQGPMRVYTPLEIANSVLAGVDIQLGPEQDLQGFIEWWNQVLETDEILGQYSEQQTLTLAAKAMEAQQMLQAIQSQQAQLANQQQIQMNAALTTQGGGAQQPQGAEQAPVGTEPAQ